VTSLPLLDSLRERIEEFYDIYCDEKAKPDKRLIALAVKTELEQFRQSLEDIVKILEQKKAKLENARLMCDPKKVCRLEEYWAVQRDTVSEVLDLLGTTTEETQG
jgi:alanyl-tRNA synthetase